MHQHKEPSLLVMGLGLGPAGDLWSSADLTTSSSEEFLRPGAQTQDSEQSLQRFVWPSECSFCSMSMWAPVIVPGELRLTKSDCKGQSSCGESGEEEALGREATPNSSCLVHTGGHQDGARPFTEGQGGRR